MNRARLSVWPTAAALALVAMGCTVSPQTSPSPNVGSRVAQAPAPPSFPVADAAAVGLDRDALGALWLRARETHSDGVVILKDGHVIADWTMGQQGPIEAMGVTRAVVCLGIGRLIDLGKIRSVDEPVWEFYPEWKQGRKKDITLRHLLTHTSGLQLDEQSIVEITRSQNYVQLALTAELAQAPGERFVNNNKAINLLAGVIARASGERMDAFIRREILEPLGVRDAAWVLDGAGNPPVMSGLQIRPMDLARVGQMMLDGGVLFGRRVVSRTWVEASVTHTLNPDYGLLWWIDNDRTMALFNARQKWTTCARQKWTTLPHAVRGALA